MPLCKKHMYVWTTTCIVCNMEDYHIRIGNEDCVPYFREGLFNKPFTGKVMKHKSAYNHGNSFKDLIEKDDTKMGDRYNQSQIDDGLKPTDSFNVNGKKKDPECVQLTINFNEINIQEVDTDPGNEETVDEVSFNEIGDGSILADAASEANVQQDEEKELNENTPLNPIFSEEIVLYRPPEDVLAEEIAKQALKSFKDNTGSNKGQFKRENTGFRLYELTGLVQSVLEQCSDYAEEHDGEIPVTLGDVLEHLEIEREEKLINCCLVYKDYMLKHDMIKREVALLNKRAESLHKHANSMHEYVKNNIRENEKFNDPRIDIPWRKSTSTDVIDLNIVPDDVCDHNLKLKYCPELSKILFDLDGTRELIEHVKVPLKKAIIKPKLEAGEDVPGMKLNKKNNFKIK